jgi:hypothetical protein
LKIHHRDDAVDANGHLLAQARPANQVHTCRIGSYLAGSHPFPAVEAAWCAGEAHRHLEGFGTMVFIEHVDASTKTNGASIGADTVPTTHFHFDIPVPRCTWKRHIEPCRERVRC